ncbi:MAG: ABC transporter ATP-binding protein/permease [Candidatus Fimenecus sp.]
MLELKNIVKTYITGVETVEALKGINLKFRKSEFVSILGPSGCGKSTMLNILGGLDQYTSGDLIINGKSTKDFSDRNWDTYRNHSIGFVFQSYQLIPHETVLKNVELSLTLSGVNKYLRKKRAKNVLELVGLGDQLKKYPSELSGGQAQRVAIARALVNDPEIILADEPTGALDTKTSVQVMELLKEISKDKLVLMVTHNPKLAEKYSTRIINILDGEITGDSNPLNENEYIEEKKADDTTKKERKTAIKPSMSLATAFSLSARNLFTKRGRTILTIFAGSIGIIGIALIFAISNGTTNYINSIQEETLSQYPLTVQKESQDYSSLISLLSKKPSGNTHDNNAVYQNTKTTEMLSGMLSPQKQKNDLKSFKDFLNKETEQGGSLAKAISGVSYTYNLPLVVYTKDANQNIANTDPMKLVTNYISNSQGLSTDMISQFMSSSATFDTSMYSTFRQMIPGAPGTLYSDVYKNQYDILYGHLPEKSDQAVLVLGAGNELDDFTLYSLGLLTADEIKAQMNGAKNETQRSWSYEKVVNQNYRVVINSSCFEKDSSTGLYKDLRNSDAGLTKLYNNGIELKIVGIIKAKDENISQAGVLYTEELYTKIIQSSQNSDAINEQKANPSKDILTGLPFKNENSSDTEKAVGFKSYVKSLSVDEKAVLYKKINKSKTITTKKTVEVEVNNQSPNYSRIELDDLTEEQLNAIISYIASNYGVSPEFIKRYMNNMSQEQLQKFFSEYVEKINSGEMEMPEELKSVFEKSSSTTEQQTITSTVSADDVPASQLATELEKLLNSKSDKILAEYYNKYVKFSDSTYEKNLTTLGFTDPNDPSSINIYASSFKDKKTISTAIDKYNNSKDTNSKIKYTDYVAMIMGSVTSIINAVTYVLIAFVAISLIVSSIMIGVITLISVQERTKEIGILRAIGASKRNISSMFNAETMIIGVSSGIFGMIISYILCIPINLIIHKITNIKTLNAVIPWQATIVLIIISVLLTLISGIIPSRSAAKKDPVDALRTE